MIPAFSTVACPEWTLAQVAQRGNGLGFNAVELRTFGDDSRQFACDPALTNESKARTLLRENGLEPVCLASGVRFDEPIFPPVVGVFSPNAERSIREGKRAIDLAVGIECPLVRVFAYEYPAREKRSAAMKRIMGRLRAVVDHADKSGVGVVIENGGSFCTAAELMEILGEIESPLLGASYSAATAIQAGEDPADGVRLLGERLRVARVKDARDGRPVLLGEGELACDDFVRALLATGFDGPLVFEWDRAWVAGLAPAEEALSHAARTLYSWIGGVGAAPASAQNGHSDKAGSRGGKARGARAGRR
jgi:sugar phosphate isomerase/epimerase